MFCLSQVSFTHNPDMCMGTPKTQCSPHGHNKMPHHKEITFIKGPFCDSEMLFIMTLLSRYRQNKHISKFPVNLEVAFETYACFTVLHLLHRPLCCIFFMLT